MGDQNRGAVPKGNIDASLNLLQMAMGIHNEPYHTRAADSLSFLQDINTEQRNLAVAGRYWDQYGGGLSDGDVGTLRLTSDGKLMVDATFGGTVVVNTAPTRWTRMFYVEMGVTAVDQTVTFVDPVLGAFDADEVIIVNDDPANSVWFNYGAAAVADVNHDKVNTSETFTDQYVSPDIHLISDVAGPSVVRIWARAEV